MLSNSKTKNYKKVAEHTGADKDFEEKKQMEFLVLKTIFYYTVCLSVCPCFTAEHTATDKDFRKKALKTDNVLSKVKRWNLK